MVSGDEGWWGCGRWCGRVGELVSGGGRDLVCGARGLRSARGWARCDGGMSGTG